MAKSDTILGLYPNQWQYVHQFPVYVSAYVTTKGKLRYGNHIDQPDQPKSKHTVYRIRVTPNPNWKYTDREWQELVKPRKRAA